MRGNPARPVLRGGRRSNAPSLPDRALRPVKTQVKISGCHQSETGAAAWAAVRSYLDSARKHGLNALDAIRRVFTSRLWMPPIAPAD